ncbi:MAG: hypothetical protein GX335_09725 [Firmicutes bacterium]|nr:hypothetical protein [Bacillota bacterium]
MVFHLEEPALQYKEQACGMLGPYLEADGGHRRLRCIRLFLEDGNYNGWLANLEALRNESAPDFAPLEVFFLMEKERIVEIVSIFQTLPPPPYNWVGI